MSKVAVVGNKDGWSKDFVFNVLNSHKITKNDIIISGGSAGIDSYAQEFAEEKGCQIRIIYPDPEISAPQKYFYRNERIAEMCDKMIAFDKGDENSGTKNKIMYAQKFGKEVIIIDEEMIDISDIPARRLKLTKQK